MKGDRIVKKGLILNSSAKTIAASEFRVEVHHKNGEVIELSKSAYSYEDVFEHIKDHYENIDDSSVQKLLIELIR